MDEVNENFDCKAEQTYLEFVQIHTFIAIAVPGCILNCLSVFVFKKLLHQNNRKSSPSLTQSPFLVCLQLLAAAETCFCVTMVIYYGFLARRAHEGMLHCLLPLDTSKMTNITSVTIPPLWHYSVLQCVLYLGQDLRNWWLVVMTTLRSAAVLSPFHIRHRITACRVKLLFLLNFSVWFLINTGWLINSLNVLKDFSVDDMNFNRSLSRRKFWNMIALELDDSKHAAALLHSLSHALVATLAPATLIVLSSAVVIFILRNKNRSESQRRRNTSDEDVPLNEGENQEVNPPEVIQRSGRASTRKRQSSATKIVIFVATSFCVCQLPLAVLTPPLLLIHEDYVAEAFGFAVMLSYLEFLTNFIILIKFSAPFRRTLLQILLCRKNSSKTRTRTVTDGLKSKFYQGNSSVRFEDADQDGQ